METFDEEKIKKFEELYFKVLEKEKEYKSVRNEFFDFVKTFEGRKMKFLDGKLCEIESIEPPKYFFKHGNVWHNRLNFTEKMFGIFPIKKKHNYFYQFCEALIKRKIWILKK